VGFSFRVRTDSIFGTVATVLSADRRSFHFTATHYGQRTKHLYLFVSDSFRFKRSGRLHRRETEQLQSMVLNDVAQRSGRVVIGAASAFHTNALGYCDANVVDMCAVKDRLEDRIAEPKCKDVLNRLFAEIVIDAENLIFMKKPFDGAVQLTRARQVVSK